jgi:putative acetyltransferase
MADSDENFLTRWSRRKLEAKGGLRRKPAGREPAGRNPEGKQEHAVQPAGGGEPRPTAEKSGAGSARTGATEAEREPKPALTKDNFADVDFEALDHTSDYTRFMGPTVPDEIRRKALHKLWLSDPILSKAEELHDYAGDFTDAACAGPGQIIQTAYKVGRGFLSEEAGVEAESLRHPPVLERLEAAVITIAAEAADQPEVHSLLAQSDAYMASLYPPESNHLVDVATLMQPNVRFFVARSDSRAIGCGALVLAGDGSAEIKRMFVLPEARRRSIGRRILEQLESAARAEGVTVIRLETGAKQPEAIGLYRAAGFQEIGPFGSYRSDPLSLFMEKWLA